MFKRFLSQGCFPVERLRIHCCCNATKTRTAVHKTCMTELAGSIRSSFQPSRESIIPNRMPPFAHIDRSSIGSINEMSRPSRARQHLIRYYDLRTISPNVGRRWSSLCFSDHLDLDIFFSLTSNLPLIIWELVRNSYVVLSYCLTRRFMSSL